MTGTRYRFAPKHPHGGGHAMRTHATIRRNTGTRFGGKEGYYLDFIDA